MEHWTRPLAALALPCLLAAACASVDTTSTPTVTSDARSRVQSMDTAGRWTLPDAATVVEPEWWHIFGDNKLSELIEKATEENLDLRILAYRIDQAELGVRSQRAAGLPQFSADIGANSSFSRLQGLSSRTSSYEGGANVSWEADIWGKVRQERAAATAEVRATESDWRAGQLFLVHEVASAYFQLRTLEEQLGIHERAKRWAEEALDVYERQLANRLVTRDVPDAQKAEVLRLEREIEEIRRQRLIEVNRLAVLLGELPGTWDLEHAVLRGRVQLPRVEEGVAANLLERRPDVVAAEERLSAAYRLTEARRAARLPTLTLGGQASFSTPGSFFASFLPRISFPALDPQTKIRRQSSEIDLEEARDRYVQAVLKAVQEAENALADLRSRQRQLAIEQQRRELLERAREDLDTRLDAGMVTRLEVLEASRSLLLAEQGELQLYNFALLDTVRLYNSLGGGW